MQQKKIKIKSRRQEANWCSTVKQVSQSTWVAVSGTHQTQLGGLEQKKAVDIANSHKPTTAPHAMRIQLPTPPPLRILNPNECFKRYLTQHLPRVSVLFAGRQKP